MRDIEELKVTPVAAVPSKVTVAPLTKSVPVMVTTVPPLGMPLVGDKKAIVGKAIVGDVGSTRVVSTVMAKAFVAA